MNVSRTTGDARNLVAAAAAAAATALSRGLKILRLGRSYSTSGEGRGGERGGGSLSKRSFRRPRVPLKP